MEDIVSARKFTDRNLARRVADQHMRKNKEVKCKILNVPESGMFLYIAIFSKGGKFKGVLV